MLGWGNVFVLLRVKSRRYANGNVLAPSEAACDERVKYPVSRLTPPLPPRLIGAAIAADVRVKVKLARAVVTARWNFQYVNYCSTHREIVQHARSGL